ncbi:hypothetical protein EmuJ_000540600 [Echinococcus multilocularis]|uniref:Uncharacterized protein n=1 Tax=Echinococcus multilocularis TaxID=6211 RepID=A0A068Y0V4_ECHMU|nr:hypothetical protein EmuJ_000540600 [Echinococcus multilocularis]
MEVVNKRTFVAMEVPHFCLILFAFSTLVREGNGARKGDKLATATLLTEGEEGATTSGAFALTFTISAILLACMGVVPA